MGVESRLEPRGRLIGELGRRRIDDNQNGTVGEGFRVGLCALGPRQIRRNQSINVGLDLEMGRGEEAAQHPKRESEGENPPRTPRAHRNDPNDR